MDAKNVPDNKLMWYVIIHLTFVLSAFVMGYLDKISKNVRGHNHELQHAGQSSSIHLDVLCCLRLVMAVSIWIRFSKK
jgi:hypothetical protein